MNAQVPADALAGALAARVAHDLAGALGGVTVALSLLDDKSAELRDEAAALIATAVGELEARLSFCRAAYGSPPGESPTSETERLAHRLFEGGRAQLETALAAGSLPGVVGQALLGLAQLAAGALGAGGQARLSVRLDGDWCCVLEALGARVRLAPEIAAALRGEAPPAGSATGRWAPAAFVYALVARRGGGIRVDVSDESLSILVRLPAPG